MSTETSTSTTIIVVVYDNPLASQTTARILKSEPDIHVAAICLNAAETLDAINQVEPAIVVFEFANSYPNGSPLLRQVGLADPDARIVIVSRHLDDLDMFRLSGASAFVAAEHATRFLAACIRNVHMGASWMEYTGRVRRLSTPIGGVPVVGK